MHLFNWSICVLEYLIAYGFANNFLKRKEVSRLGKIVTFLLLSSLLFAVNLLNSKLLNPIAFCLFAFEINSIFFLGSISTKIALAVFFSILPIATEFLSTSVLSLILQGNVKHILSFPHNKVIATFISIFTLWGIVKAIKFSYPKSNYKASNPKINVLLVLPLSSIIILLSLLYFEQWIPATFNNAFLTCFICVLLGVVNLIVFNVYDDQMKAAELKTQLLNARLAQEKTEEYYHAQEQYLQDMHALTHDFKNHLTAIRAMANTDKPLNDYLDQLSGRLTETSRGMADYTDNKVINVILYQKQQTCLENNIELTIEGAYSALSFIRYSDACSIFGNALDNATAACLLQIETRRYINISVYRHNEMLIVEFVNSKNPSIELLTDEKRMFKTTKQQTQLHGYGLINIKEAVRAYNGHTIFEDDKDTFNVTIFIPLT